VRDCCKEKYKPLKKQIEEDCKRWNDLLCLWIGWNNIVKMATSPKEIYILSAIPINTSNDIHHREWKINARVNFEDPDVNPYCFTYLIFDKGDKSYYWGKIASSTNVAGKTGYLLVENKLHACLV
jgi:hypothetical protein